MRLDIEDQLISEALRVTGLKTERETVELGLRTLLRLHQREAMRPLRGKLQWEGGFDGLRGTE